MTDKAELFIDSRCELGEGIFWHPLVERVFWFDILNKTLFSATAGGIMVDRFTFEATVTAAGVIDADNLAIASAAGIFQLNLKTDSRELLAPLGGHVVLVLGPAGELGGDRAVVPDDVRQQGRVRAAVHQVVRGADDVGHRVHDAEERVS